MKDRIAEKIMAVCLLILVYGISREAGIMVSGQRVVSQKEKPVVVIDAGHGGRDPGKVGVDGSLEKDINLQIAEQLKLYLEASDVEVVMTRDGDMGWYDEDDSNKKMADMKKRCEIINESNPAVVISIHQNSYHEESVSGGQVFYYKGSEKGIGLAGVLQRRLNQTPGAGSARTAKSNDNYYLLLHVKSPIVIVECGFLSNWNDAKALNSEEYQDRLAWSIHMGIMEFLNGKN